MSAPSLTVAIPTMRRWGFLEKTLPTYLSNALIHAVVICDETGEDADAIEASEFAAHPKLKVYRNPTRLGIYYNKRKCIEVSPTDWVAVLDSDNLFDHGFFDTLKDIWTHEGANPKHFYAAGNALFISDTGAISNRLQSFAGIQLHAGTWNQIFDYPQWNYMLNDGNWVVHRSVLTVLPTTVRDEDILATDAIFMARLFVQNGYVYDIRHELFYIHAIHKSSSWNLFRQGNMRIWESTNWKL